MTHSELWQRMEWLGSKVAKAMPSDSAVAQVFAQVSADNGDEWTPPVELLLSAHAAFMALTDETRQRIMGGWTYRPAYPVPAAVFAEEAACGGIAFNYRVLIGGRSEVAGYRNWGVDDVNPRAVTVSIVEGTAQAEAIAHLDSMLRMVREQWAELVGPEPYVEQKSGTPEASNTPSLGGGMGGLKLAPTAA